MGGVGSFSQLKSPAVLEFTRMAGCFARTLTTGSDVSGVLVGSAGTTSTEGSDTFNATQSTYTSGDVILGGNSNDILTVTSNIAILAEPTVVGVEAVNFNISTLNLGAADVAVGGISSSNITVNQLQAGAFATSAVTNLGTANVTFGTGITGATTVTVKDAVTNVINAGSSIGVTVTGVAAATGSTTVNGGALTTAASVTMSGAGTAVVNGDALTTITSVAKTATLSTKAATTGAGFTIDGTGSADAATISIGATATITNGIANLVETLTISTGTTQSTASVATIANAAATTYNLTGANAITLATSQGAAVSLVSGKTVASNATGAAKVELTLVAGNANTEDLTKVASAVAINVKGTANAGDTLSVANNATVNATTDTTTDLEINGVTATATSNVLNLGVSSDQTAGITVTNTKTINLNVTANSIIDTGAAATGLAVGTADVIVTGTKNLTLGTASVAASVDATGLSGVLTATVDTAKITNIKGGSGNDLITVVTAVAATIDGGAGTGDQITFGIDASTVTFSNFEVAQLTGGPGATTTFKASQLTGSTMAIKGDAGGTGVIGINAAGLVDATTIDFSKLMFDGNVGSLVIDTQVGNLSGIAALGSQYNITGSKLDDTISLATNTGANTVNGGAGADAISGGIVVDNITGGEGADTIIGGAGADVINLTETTALVDVLKYNNTTDSKSTGVDVVTGYAKASDTIDMANSANGGTAAGAITFAVIANVTATAGTTNGIATGLFTFDKAAPTSLTDAIAKVGADVAVAGKAVVFNYGSDAYLFIDADGATTTTNDMVVKLVGVTAASVAAAAEVFTVS
jgi:hypothetical protein